MTSEKTAQMGGSLDRVASEGQPQETSGCLCVEVAGNVLSGIGLYMEASVER
jgi:hypothetical protein